MTGRGMGCALRGGGLIGRSAQPKVKKYAEGGLAQIADNAESLMEEVDNMATTINEGKPTGFSSSATSSPNASAALFKKGGMVNSSTLKRKTAKTKSRAMRKGK
jgi:hypothetical protein